MKLIMKDNPGRILYVLVVCFCLFYSKRFAIVFQLNSVLNVNRNGGELSTLRYLNFKLLKKSI